MPYIERQTMSNTPIKTDADYKRELSDIEYQVTRHAATERSFTGRYWDHWENGVYKCVCCGAALFASNLLSDSNRAAPHTSACAGEIPCKSISRSRALSTLPR